MGADDSILDPIDALGAALAGAWAECGVAMRPHMAGTESGEQEGQYILTMLEFFYFFMHLTDRYALPILGRADRDWLMEELIPLSIDYVAKILFSRFEDDYQQDVRRRLPEGVAKRDSYYADGDMMSPEPGMKSERVWIVTMLIRNVNIKSGKPPNDPLILREVIRVVTDQMVALQLEKRVSGIKEAGRMRGGPAPNNHTLQRTGATEKRSWFQKLFGRAAER
ncbi:hypothetical protein BH10ACI2_BH10ACI2_12440 [soil metagenome]